MELLQIKMLRDVETPKQTAKGDWIDLRAGVTVKMRKGEFYIIPLGVAMKIPNGYEAHIVPRSSTFKNWGVIQTNHMGVVDSSYCGNDDEWCIPVYATGDTIIHKGDRICQFRIMKKMGRINMAFVDNLDGENRGGFGSTGVR